jgi:hypothetical protein
MPPGKYESSPRQAQHVQILGLSFTVRFAFAPSTAQVSSRWSLPDRLPSWFSLWILPVGGRCGSMWSPSLSRSSLVVLNDSGDCRRIPVPDSHHQFSARARRAGLRLADQNRRSLSIVSRSKKVLFSAIRCGFRGIGF